VISRHAEGGNAITVVGPLGRPWLRRILQGRSFRRLLARVKTPLLYVPVKRLPVRNVLVCLGGLGYALGVEHLSIYLARKAGASVTLLHVVEPVTRDYPVAQKIQGHWQQILETDTPQGRNLRSALEDMQRAGLAVEFHVRMGSVVREILEEVRSGKYDLVAMGSPYSSESLRHLFELEVDWLTG
jgi:nucleotide-binding universal stress UspA family protein